MAGIGFELKKLFSKKGLFAMIRAYGYAGVVCTGPMLLGIILLLGVHSIAELGGAATHEQELLICMITYTLLASLLVTNIVSMVTTRYVADLLFVDLAEKIMPSFYGSIALMMVLGGTLYGIFLLFSGITFIYKILSFILFMELIVTWTQINYLTAIKDFGGILRAFALAVAVALLVGYALIKLKFPPITTLLSSVILGYGVMMIWYYRLMLMYFPKGKGSSLSFLRWFDKYPQLSGVGSFVGFGLFLHLVMMWFSPIGVQVEGLFYGAPGHDVPALFAFVSILVTTINFVTSVEVNFYPKYRIYYGLYNSGGSLLDIERAEEELKSVLNKELSYTFTKQFFISVVFIVGGTLLIPYLPFGFTEEMLGIFRVLCVGYAFYAAGNCMMLISLYFADNTGALMSTAVYAASTIIGTFICILGDSRYYGFGFLVGGILFTMTAFLRLYTFLRNLSYHVISMQPMFNREKRGIATRISEYFEAK